MAGEIFISYRREDSAGTTGRLYDRLAKTFSRKKLFMDVDERMHGLNFVKVLSDKVEACAVFLAVIGPGWVSSTAKDGGRRLDNPNDFVRIEVASALRRNIPLIPVLVDGAAMPSAQDLPDDIKELALRHAVQLRNAHFNHDSELVVGAIKARLNDDTPGRPWGLIAGGGIAAFALLGLVAYNIGVPILPTSGAPPGPPAITTSKAGVDAGTKPKPDTDAAERQRIAALKADEERQRAAAEAKRKADAAAAKKAQDDEAERQRVAAELRERQAAEQRQREAAAKKAEGDRRRAEAEAEAKRKADEAERQRIAKAKAEAEAALKAIEEAARRIPKPGQVFRDCQDKRGDAFVCPEMVVVPAGSFTMGSPASEADRDADEGPQRKVTMARPFAVGKFEVTFAEWDACVAEKGCTHKPGDQGWGRVKRPVINVSWDDAKQYVVWLSRKTGQSYRLLTEAEWEYAARAGTTTPFSTGRTITAAQANFDGNFVYGGSAKGQYRQRTIDVGTFAANPFGLHDMHGNVWEWVEDCYADRYSKAPTDGRKAPDTNGCSRVLRGGSWNIGPRLLRAARRINFRPVNRFSGLGFRLARTLIPTP